MGKPWFHFKEERWFRLYLSSMVLVPLGLVCLIWGATRPESSEKLAITLVVLGAGMLVFGGFGPRMQGTFKIGPSGAEGGLAPFSPAEKAVVIKAARRRLAEAEAKGEVDPVKNLVFEAAVLDAAEIIHPATTKSARRRYYRRAEETLPPEETAALERLGESLANAVIEAANQTSD